MVKAYLNYEHLSQCSSVLTNSLPTLEEFEYKEFKLLLTAGNETLYMISKVSGEVQRSFNRKDKSTTVSVTCIASIGHRILIGYNDGEIVVYNFKDDE